VGNRIQRAIAGVCIVAYLSGCTGWHTVPAAGPMPVSERPRSLRLTLRDSQRLELRKARVVGDSVIGEKVIATGHGFKSTRVAVAVTDIRQFEDRRVNTLATVAAAVAAVAVALFIAVAVAAQSVS
jgi:hypothetical protein